VPLAPLGQPVSLSIPKAGVLVPVKIGKRQAPPDQAAGSPDAESWPLEQPAIAAP